MIIKQDIRPNKMIWVTFRKEGIHKYPAALTDPALATGDEYDVSFLGYPHRHIFHFRVWINVLHNDRDIEFIQFKRWLESLYNGNTSNNNNQGAVLSLDYKSCEMMSDDLHDIISKKYPGREIWIEISEDGENGSFIKY
jgi:frataxin-like iron-binding protein CyaY